MKANAARRWLRMLGWLSLAVLVNGQIAPVSAAAPEVQPLVVSGFVSASNLPLWVGQREGFFRAEGVELTLRSPAGSIDQMRGIVSGDTPVLLTAFDNVVAYQRGQGAAEIGAIGDFVAIAGIDNGMLTLVTAPDVADVHGLQGRALAVDAATTGFSFALRGVLAKAGIDTSGNPLVAVGNTMRRWKALQDGLASGAVLTIPADTVAVASGFKALTTVDDALGPYQGNVVGTRRGWAELHRPILNAFLRAYRRSLDWLMTPDHQKAATDILRQEMPELTPSLAQRVYARLLDPRSGLFRTMEIDPAGLRAVLDLRARFGPPSKATADLQAYSDPSFLRDAWK